MAVWRSAGKHLYYLQGDVLVVRVGGTVNLEEAQLFMTTSYELVQRFGYSLMLADVSAGIAMPPEVRRWIGEWHKTHAADSGSAVVTGAGMVARTLLTLINSGVRLLGMQTGDLIFAKSDAEAWEIVAQRRQLWQQRVAAAGPHQRSSPEASPPSAGEPSKTGTR